MPGGGGGKGGGMPPGSRPEPLDASVKVRLSAMHSDG
jgi:hypothetical protein